jgi:hypothetical protein
MRRITAASAVFGLVLVAVAAVGQPPPPGGDKKPADKKDAEKKADPVEALIAAALANDPDVRMARAKVQLAEAELAKARQQVTVKVVTLQAAIREQKTVVATARETATLTERLGVTGQAPQREVVAARGKLEAAQAVLAKLETELQLVTGGGPGGLGLAAAPDDAIHRDAASRGMTCAVCHMVTGARAGAADPGGADPAVLAGLAWLGVHGGVKPGGADPNQFFLHAFRGAGGEMAIRGAIPERIRAALDKKVTLAPKGEKVPLDKALEVFKKEAGLDVPVRGVGDLVTPPVVVSQGEEMTVGAWLQLYEDYSGGLGRFYVREYGLLFTIKNSAPPDALTVTQFWKAQPAPKGEKPRDDPEKK